MRRRERLELGVKGRGEILAGVCLRISDKVVLGGVQVGDEGAAVLFSTSWDGWRLHLIGLWIVEADKMSWKRRVVNW